MKNGSLLISAFFMLSITACATPSANLPATNYYDKEAIRRDHKQYGMNYAKERDKRIQSVFYQIVKNTGPELCNRKLHPGLGFGHGVRRPRLSWWQSLNAEQKAEEEDLKELSPRAEDNTIYVRYVIPGSAADKAGLKEHDRILSVFGLAVPNGNNVRTHFQKMLDKNLTNSQLGLPVEMEVARRGKTIRLSIEPDEICPYQLLIDKSSHEVNAYSDGENVYLTEEIIDYLQEDIDLAAVLSHELAHNTLGHSNSKQINLAIGAVAGAIIDTIADTEGTATLIGAGLGADAYSKEFESEADYVSVYYMARSGFDYKSMRNLHKKLAARNPSSLYIDGITHPKPQERYALFTETAKEIDLKNSFKQELLPDFKTRNSYLEEKRD